MPHLTLAQGGEGENNRGRHHGEDAGAIQHAGDHGQGRGADSLRYCLLPGQIFTFTSADVAIINFVCPSLSVAV